MSWMTEWAEKGGNFLNNLDSRVADLLGSDEAPITSPTSQPEGAPAPPPTQPPPPPPPLVNAGGRRRGAHRPPPPTAIVKPRNPSPLSKKATASPAKTTSIQQADKDAELFEFLNNPAPLEQIQAPTMTSATPVHTIDAPEMGAGSQEASPPSTTTTMESVRVFSAVQQLAPRGGKSEVEEVDASTENRLLHNEITALNEEVAGLLKRNRSAEMEAQAFRKQVESVTAELYTTRADREDLSKTIASMAQEAERLKAGRQQGQADAAAAAALKAAEDKVKSLTDSLNQTRQSQASSEARANEALRAADASRRRAEQLQQEVLQINRCLADYKEKAALILTAKEKTIADLQTCTTRGEGGTGGESGCETSAFVGQLQTELEWLKSERDNLQQETERRALVAAELEEQTQVEHASLRKTIALIEEQLAREKQLREEADSEIIDLQRRLNSGEERAAREKADLHSMVQSNEAELARMRRLLAETPSGAPPPLSSSSPARDAPPPRSDAEQLLALEARVRQLNDSLITRQDALDATLAQNHGLKIRLERLEAENDTRLLVSGADVEVVGRRAEWRSAVNFPGGHPQLPFHSTSSLGTPSGFARLHLIDTTLPGWAHTCVTGLDGAMIRVVAYLRRRPLFRLLIIVYLCLLHAWFLFGLVFFAPSPSPHPPPPDPPVR